jgi:membrane protein
MRARFRSAVAALRSAFAQYSRHACSELAAAIAYRVLFSLVPFVALLAAVLDAALPTAAREDLVGWLFGGLPGSALEDSVDRELASSGAFMSLAGAVALGTLLWTASGMTRSLRIAFAVIWEAGARPAFVRAKLRDVAALGILAALVIAGFGLSLIAQVTVQAGVDAGEALGLGQAARVAMAVAELAASGAATFAALLVVYRRVAPVVTPLRAVWPATLVTALAIDAGVAAYAYYVVHLASFNTIYGPLGAVLAFLALLYVAAGVVLFGAELIVATTEPPRPAGSGRSAPRRSTARGR